MKVFWNLIDNDIAVPANVITEFRIMDLLDPRYNLGNYQDEIGCRYIVRAIYGSNEVDIFAADTDRECRNFINNI